MSFNFKNTLYIDNSYYYLLSKISWKIFGTLTFRSKSKRNIFKSSRSSRDYDFKHLLENTFYRLNIYFEDVPYFLRHEFSETRKYHLHFLIANHRKLDHLDAFDLASDLTSCWKRDFAGPKGSNGSCFIEPYKNHKDGPKYICKVNPWQDSSYFEDFQMSDALIQMFRSITPDTECNPVNDNQHRADISRGQS